MASQTTFTYVDHSGETSRVTFNHADLDATNVAGYTSTVVTDELGALKAAVDALTLLNEVQISVGATNIVSPATLPSDENAQREQGLLIKYIDTVTAKKYRFTIPGINRALVAQQGTDVVDFVNNVLVAALVAAFEANYTSEFGNAVSVYAASMVGRAN
ncbi:MAG: hypothetical protein H6658_20675 [Ardenticatenaceae bacterium]|nr:hypothetical protein [Ardenticatenaceae bacterium]